MSIYVIRREMFSPNTGESLQDYPLATWPAQNLTRTFNCTPLKTNTSWQRLAILLWGELLLGVPHPTRNSRCCAIPARRLMEPVRPSSSSVMRLWPVFGHTVAGGEKVN